MTVARISPLQKDRIMKRVAWIIVLFMTFSTTNAGRPWPDTTSDIRHFSDQLLPGMTDEQHEFAATHLVGCQKLTRDILDPIRSVNPDFILLDYLLGFGIGEFTHPEGYQWLPDPYDDLDQNYPEFFLTHPTSPHPDQRILQTDWNWWVLDPEVDDYRDWFVNESLRRRSLNLSDGVFADSCSYPWNTSPSQWWPDGTNQFDFWDPSLNGFLAHVHSEFANQLDPFYLIPNAAGLVTTVSQIDYSLTDGVMVEQFAMWGVQSPFDFSDWQLQMNRILDLQHEGKVIICQNYMAADDYDTRMFYTGCHLLCKGAACYLAMFSGLGLEWYPEYDIPIGAYSYLPGDISELWAPDPGIYIRNFDNGLVLVNPTSADPGEYVLPQESYLVSASGGGPVPGDGIPTGTLTYEEADSVNLGPYDAAVIINSTAATATPAPMPDQPVDLTAVHRSGQTFITWMELSELTGESYRIYRYEESIDASNLDQATLLYEVSEGSGNFYANRYNTGSGVWEERYLERFVIEDGGEQLAVGEGLLVWTLCMEDFGGEESGTAYYAVTSVSPYDQENVTDFTNENSIGPVMEAVNDPLPVEVDMDIGEGGHLYLQYMDLRQWNPTFHAPHAANGYFGLDPADPAVSESIQYAYDYVIYEPRESLCGGSVPPSVPLFLNLHGWGGNSYGPVLDLPDQYWCTYAVYLYDVSETWYFGFAGDHDYRLNNIVEECDVIVNYTEQRILRILYDLLRNPPGAIPDPERLYVFGHSMGGSGTLALSLRYPNVFAAAYASEPMTNYSTCGDGGGIDWRVDVAWKWGAPELNLPVEIDGPGDWADHLKKYDGMGVWDWQNHQDNIQERSGDEMVPFGVAHGMNDYVIEWPTQGYPAYGAFNAGKRTWGGAVTSADHFWQGFNGLPHTIAGAAPFSNFQAIKSETIPGLSNADNDLDLPPAEPGKFNHTLRWSSSWDPWDGPPIDDPNLWRIALCSISADPYTNDCGTGIVQTVDVTPRRLQNFIVTPGAQYAWENRTVSDNTLVDDGIAIADENGLITVADFAVGPQRNRLVLIPQATATPSPTPSASPEPPVIPSSDMKGELLLLAILTVVIVLGRQTCTGSRQVRL